MLVQGNAGGTDQSWTSLKSTVPPENRAKAKSASGPNTPPKSTKPPENRANLKPTVPPENMALLKSTSLPENWVALKLTGPPENWALLKSTMPPQNWALLKSTRPQENLALLNLTLPSENSGPRKSPPSKTTPVKSRSRPCQDVSGRARAQFTWGYGGTGPHDLSEVLVADMLGTLAYCPSCFGSIPAGGGLIQCPSCDGDGLRQRDIHLLQRACYRITTGLSKRPDPALQNSDDSPPGAQWRLTRTKFLQHAFRK